MEKGLMTREVEQGLTSLIDELFAPMRPPAAVLPKGWLPRVDVQETEKEYVLSAALPGVRKEDVRVDVRDGVLTIIGERRSEKEEKGKTWLRKETSYGAFERSFVLPDGTHPEEVRAGHKDGVLTISMPKPAETKHKGVRIAVE